MKKAEELYVEICKLPLEEQVKFFEWAREYIKELDKELEKQSKQNASAEFIKNLSAKNLLKKKEKENELSSSKTG